jgi:hypothetical protein
LTAKQQFSASEDCELPPSWQRLVIQCCRHTRALKKTLFNVVTLINRGLDKILNPLALFGSGARGTNDEGDFHGL